MQKRSPDSIEIERAERADETPAERATRVARLRLAVRDGRYDADPETLAALILFGPRSMFGAPASHPRH